MSPEPGVGRARLDPDAGERFVRLRSELGVTAFGLNQMILEPGQRGRIHRHERQEEVYLVLEGTLTVAIEAREEPGREAGAGVEELQLGEGDLLRVGPELRRQLINSSGERCVFLAIGGAGEHPGRDGEAFESWDSERGAPPQEVPLPEDLPPG